MSFFKTAKTQILAYSDHNASTTFTRTASTVKIASHYGSAPEGAFSVEDIKQKLAMVADSYKISTSPKDYVYVAVRALTADVPNENHDAFSEKELLRFDQKQGCSVYQTFNLKPHHINHRSQDPTQARGVILDSHYNTKNAEHFPEILIAVDKTKDKRLAEGIASGELTGFSMGCTADVTICSVCDHEAASPADFCKHIRFSKGKEVQGKVAFEWCEGVTFEEESSVDDPADKSALTQEVILASKENPLETESELLVMNTKLNTLNANVNKILTKIEGEAMANNKVASANKKAEEQIDTKPTEIVEKPAEEIPTTATVETTATDIKSEDIEDYKEDEEEENKKKITKEEYGVDMTQQTASKENPYSKLIAERKQAYDKDGKEILTKYLGDYGTEAAKDIKKKKVISDKKADKGQLFTKIDNKAGNPPKDFTIDKKKGNPPADWKFAKIHSDVEVFPVSRVANIKAETSKYFLVAKSKVPVYLVANPVIKDTDSEHNEATQVAIEMVSDIAENGLTVAMKHYNAKKLKALYDIAKGPSFTDNYQGDLKNIKKNRPTQGIEEGSTDDLAVSDRGKVKEKAVNDDGVRDLKAARIAGLEELLNMLDEAESKGTPDNEVLQMVDTYLNSNANGQPGLSASKDASIADEGQVDLAGIKKSDATEGIAGKGTLDLAGVDRSKINNSEVYSGGKDDLDIPRNNAVDLKANRRKVSPKASTTQDNLHSTEKKEFGEQLNKGNSSDAGSEKWKTIQKANITKEITAQVKTESAKEIAEFKKAFRERFTRAIRLAGKRAQLNLVDNELKIVLADTLLTPTEEFIGMDEELAKGIIEESFARGNDNYIASLLKEAEDLIEMPVDSFLKIEDDTNKLNLVIPVADVKDSGLGLPGEGIGEMDMDMESPDLGLPEETDEVAPLVEKASRSNPFFSPKGGFGGNRFENLRGIFKRR